LIFCFPHPMQITIHYLFSDRGDGRDKHAYQVGPAIIEGQIQKHLLQYLSGELVNHEAYLWLPIVHPDI